MLILLCSFNCNCNFSNIPNPCIYIYIYVLHEICRASVDSRYIVYYVHSLQVVKNPLMVAVKIIMSYRLHTDNLYDRQCEKYGFNRIIKAEHLGVGRRYALKKFCITSFTAL